LSQLPVSEEFIQAASEWICDGYSLDIRYLATSVDGRWQILDASLVAFPLARTKPTSFSIKFGTLIAGQEFTETLSKVEILHRLSLASQGKLTANGVDLYLQEHGSLEHYSEYPNRENWVFDLHLQVSGARLQPLSSADAVRNDQELRQINPPFDGMADLSSWLQLSDKRGSGQANGINMRVNPPAGVAIDESCLESNRLQLKLDLHPKFDPTSVHLAIREFPGKGIETRKQVGNLIVWQPEQNSLRKGVLDLTLSNADSVQTMLVVGNRTVLRRWFFDSGKAVNSRYVATQLFDKDLKQLRRSLVDATDSVAFERGVASLFFLLGFSPALQLESASPDILITTPGGQIVLVECTIKISNFHNKVGKLVDRRNALVKVLEASNHNLRVDAFLICGLPISQIAVDQNSLTQHQVVLLSREGIVQAFDQLRIPSNPDEFLKNMTASLTAQKNLLG